MARKQGGLVSAVIEGSLAAHLGIEIGDRIISVNGRGLRDELDFRFYSAEEDLALLVRKRNGTEQAFEIEKDPGEPVGVTFGEPIFDRVKTCNNNCTFCFVRQIPKGMRKPLHQRDDDYRMSFLYGNFISLTNLTEDDWRRLEEQRLSPLRISVHTTDPALRQELMGNPEAGRVMEHLRRLSGLGIHMHAQIVLLKGINDGDRLWRTLMDLDSLGDSMVSVGVVPAVYTRYRTEPPSPGTDRAWAGETLDLIEEYARGAGARRGNPWVYGADEFYLTAVREFPPYEYYGEFHQYENGIGVVVEFRRGMERATQLATGGRPRPVGRAIAVTGTMAAGELRKVVESLGLGDRVLVCAVPNVFFGEAVTVAGLLTGQDIAAAVLACTRDGKERYDAVLVPSVALHEGRFLDNLELNGLSSVTGIPALPVEPSAESLVRVFYTGEA
jgi:putative radical SAM enzyme (TIGR03279 family)